MSTLTPLDTIREEFLLPHPKRDVIRLGHAFNALRRLASSDAEVLRFLWAEDIHFKQPRGLIQMGRLAEVHDRLRNLGCPAPRNWTAAQALLKIKGTPEHLANVWRQAVRLAGGRHPRLWELAAVVERADVSGASLSI